MYTIRAHPVHVKKIIKLRPLVSDSQHLLSPDAGVTLVFENESTARWLRESNAPTPRVGDYFVEDKAVHADYIAPAEAFDQLFEVDNANDVLSATNPAPVSKEEYRSVQTRLYEIEVEMKQVGFGTTAYQQLEKERYELLAKKGR